MHSAREKERKTRREKYIYEYIYVCVYIHTHRKRKREKERQREEAYFKANRQCSLVETATGLNEWHRTRVGRQGG